MFPLRDNIESHSRPVVTWVIILINCLVFFIEMMVPENGVEQFMNQFGLIPAVFVAHFGWSQLSCIISSMFLHGGLGHLLGNMWFLFVFGDTIEDRLGHVAYGLFYLFTGICAALAQVAMAPASNIVVIGASGAISGVLGAYFILYPRAKVLTLIPLGFFSRLMEIPAVLFLALWFLMQALGGLQSALAGSSADAGGVAFFAHVGGFLAGAAVAKACYCEKRSSDGML